MTRNDVRSSRMERKSPNESGNQEDLDATIPNIPIENMEESPSTSHLPPEQSSEQMWILINQRLDELEKRTQRILAEEAKHREQQIAEKDKALQAKLKALETSISRSLEASTSVTQSMEDREIRMQAQINQLETGHARVAERITKDLNTRPSTPLR